MAKLIMNGDNCYNGNITIQRTVRLVDNERQIITQGELIMHEYIEDIHEI
jgi:hypothetical protein